MTTEDSRTKQQKEDKKDLNIIKLEKGETVNLTKALGSNKRLAILRHTSEEALNLSEIAEKIDSTPQAVYHHLQILEKSKLIRVVKEEKIKNMDKTIKYYRSNFQPDGINLILWAPLENIESTQLQERVPRSKTP
ncbi:MAG: ArsR/SmtB family transcription factor, partial [Candidatus Heimdallarchaeaceae archaeon]